MKRKTVLRNAVIAILLLAVVIPMFAGRADAAKELRAGDTIKFGSYEQDDIFMNGAEPIEWYVLSVNDETALLLSKYALFSGAYNESWASLTWDRCTLRDWMNDDFYESAFSSSEQDAIVTSILRAEKNPVYKTSAGEDTEDKVFVLSISEASRFLKEARLLKGVPTEYAVSCGARRTKDGTCWYWLRSPGEDRTTAAYVTTEVTINEKGVPLNYYDAGVRPAIWVDLSKLG